MSSVVHEHQIAVVNAGPVSFRVFELVDESVAFRRKVWREDTAVDEEFRGADAEDVERPIAGTGFIKNSIGELFVAGSYKLAFDERIFFAKRIQQWLR